MTFCVCYLFWIKYVEVGSFISQDSCLSMFCVGQLGRLAELGFKNVAGGQPIAILSQAAVCAYMQLCAHLFSEQLCALIREQLSALMMIATRFGCCSKLRQHCF